MWVGVSFYTFLIGVISAYLTDQDNNINKDVRRQENLLFQLKIEYGINDALYAKLKQTVRSGEK